MIDDLLEVLQSSFDQILFLEVLRSKLQFLDLAEKVNINMLLMLLLKLFGQSHCLKNL
jgi:hypothetical protein